MKRAFDELIGLQRRQPTWLLARLAVVLGPAPGRQLTTGISERHRVSVGMVLAG